MTSTTATGGPIPQAALPFGQVGMPSPTANNLLDVTTFAYQIINLLQGATTDASGSRALRLGELTNMGLQQSSNGVFPPVNGPNGLLLLNQNSQAPLANIPSGLLLNTRTFTTIGTTAYVPTTGTNKIVVLVIAGGGGTGGSTAAGASAAHVTCGGGGGGFCMSLITSGFSGTNITVGAGGTAGTSGGGNGGMGGTSSFGSFLSATGGAASFGATGTGNTGPAIVSGVASGGQGTGGNILNSFGQCGALGILYSTTNMTGGGGGGSYLSGGGPASTAIGASLAVPGSGGNSYGSGASGVCVTQSGAAIAGSPGGQGIVIIFEYN